MKWRPIRKNWKRLFSLRKFLLTNCVTRIFTHRSGAKRSRSGPRMTLDQSAKIVSNVTTGTMTIALAAVPWRPAARTNAKSSIEQEGRRTCGVPLLYQ